MLDRTTHILVVEDDTFINQLLCRILKKSGYSPQPAYSGTEAMIYLERQEWDMVLLDLMLPGLPGEELLVTINKKSLTPVIVISAKEEQETKVHTLRIGADDYITKPFDVEEVSARIHSHLRRYSRMTIVAPSDQIEYKDITLDKDTKIVTINQSEVILTSREFAILELFMTYPKKVFSKANLFESVWEDTFVGDDNTINVHMSNLRNKLSKANPEEDYIETLWGMGYRLK